MRERAHDAAAAEADRAERLTAGVRGLEERIALALRDDAGEVEFVRGERWRQGRSPSGSSRR